MLKLDIASLPETELTEVVSHHCSRLGTVKSVKIVQPADQIGYAVALVNMSTADELAKVLVKIGDSKFGSTVIIRLEQDEKQIGRASCRERV